MAAVLLALALCTSVAAQELALGNPTASPGSLVNVPLTLTSSKDVQGLIAAFDWDPAGGTGENLLEGAALAAAESIFTRIESSFAVLAVVVDITDDANDTVIPAGTDLDLATAQIRCAAAPGTTLVEFRDGAYAATGENPKLRNEVVVDFESVDATNGLVSQAFFRSAVWSCLGFISTSVGGAAGALERTWAA